MKNHIRLGLAAGVLALTSSTLSAQNVRGAVTDAGSSPVAGVVVILVDSASREVARAYTNDRGEYRIAAPRAGTYRVRTLRIGFRSQTGAAFTVGSADAVDQPIRLASVPLGLDTMRAVGRSACRLTERDSAAATWRVWQQVRAALAITQLARANRGMAATTLSFTKTLEPVRRQVQSQEFDVRADFVSQPWRAATPAELHRLGYIITDASGGMTYHAPSIEALLSEEFLEDHCLRLANSSDNQLIGIEFEPNRDRRDVPGIRGTVWVARATSELRSLEYRYANASRDAEGFGGGDMEFARMKNGAWAVSAWSIRMPALMLKSDKPGAVPEIEAIRVVGGQLALVTVGDDRQRDTVWAQTPHTLAGTVSDTAGNPLRGGSIELAGTAIRAPIANDGRFTFSGILPGIYTMKLWTGSDTTPVLQAPFKFADTTAAVRVLLPQRIVAASANAARTGQPRGAASFRGTVRSDSLDQPIADAEVSLPVVGLTGRSDARGAFTISGIAPGTHQVVVRRVGYGPMSTVLTFTEGQAMERAIVLTKLTVLDSIVTVASPDPMMLAFEEHRKRGFGVFKTRAELERFDGLTLQTVAQQLSGLAYIRGKQGQLWLTGRREVMTQCRVNPMPREGEPPTDVDCIRRERRLYVPDDAEVWSGLRIACYSEVWMDRTLLNRGRPSFPFDVNTIPVSQVEALEWYSGDSQVPSQYQNSGMSRCGVLVLHTRRFRK